MKKDIILSGVGGQGILSIATVIGKAALKDGLYMKQAEVHGANRQINLRTQNDKCHSQSQKSAILSRFQQNIKHIGSCQEVLILK